MISVQSRLLALSRAAGHVLSVAGIALLVCALWRSDAWSTIGTLSPALLIGCIILCAIANMLQGLAWIVNLDGAIAWPLDRALVRAHARSVMAKYLPGNVFQFVSRQIDLAGSKYSQPQVALASISEIIGLVTAALGFISVACATGSIEGVLVRFGFSQSFIQLIPIAGPVWWIVGVLALLGLSRLRLKSLLFYLGYFALFELCGQFLLSGFISATIPPFVGLFSVAWVAGYVVVGSPGGLGVREAAMLYLLSALAPTAILAGFIIVFRLICIVADAIYTAAALAVGRRIAGSD